MSARPSSPSDSGKYQPLLADDSEITITDSRYLRLDVDDSHTILRSKGSKERWLPLAFLIIVFSLLSGLAGFYIGRARVIRVTGDFTSSYEDTPWGAVHSSIQCQFKCEYFLTELDVHYFSQTI